MKFIQFVLAMIVTVLAAAKLNRNHRRNPTIKFENQSCGMSDQKCDKNLHCCPNGQGTQSFCKRDSCTKKF